MSIAQVDLIKLSALTDSIDASVAAAAEALSSAGVNPNFISYDVSVLPDSTGASTGDIGSYFNSSQLLQKVEWSGSEWVEVGSPIPTKNYVDDKASLLANETIPSHSMRRKKTPLDIPTYDGNPDTTHPDVVYVPEGWNGYTYWMAFTPFPGNSRENPSIVASNNGSDWEVPEGLVNPVYDQQDAQNDGYDFNSDTDMVLVDDTMYLYWRPAKSEGGERFEAVFLKTSTDGVNWTETQKLIEVVEPNGLAQLISPAVIKMPNSEMWYMFTVNNPSGNDVIERWESTDGINWGNRTPTETDGLRGRAFHMDAVVTNDNRVHILVHTSANSPQIAYLWSDDEGLIFQGNGLNCIPQVSQFDDFYRYRSTFQPVPGRQGTFHVWLTVRKTNPTLHRITEFLPNFELGRHNIGREEDTVFVPARSLYPRDSAVNDVVIDSRHHALELPNGTNFIIGSVGIPKWWPKVYWQVIYTNMSENTGDFFLQMNFMQQIVDSFSPQDITPSELRVEGAHEVVGEEKIGFASGEFPEGTFTTDLWNRNNQENFGYLALRMGRINNSEDTLSGSIGILGIKFSYRPIPTLQVLSRMSDFPD